jgi:parvulin-like peptidyl-prolyl isomerase
MINRHLIFQACKKQNIVITETQVTEEIQRMSSKFGLSMEAYLKLLKDERHISPKEYSQEIIWPLLALRQLVSTKVQVSEEEFNRAFLAEFGEAVKCRMIMLSKEETAHSVREQAVKSPELFAQLAKQYSVDESSASVGGLIPPIRRYSGDSRIEEAAFALPNDGVSTVIQLADQWIILQSVRRLPATTPSPQAMPMIREQIVDRIRDEKLRVASSELFTQLQKESQVVKVIGNEAASKQYPGVAAIVNGQQVSLAMLGNECIDRHGEEVLNGEINRKLLLQAIKAAKMTITDADVQSEIARAATSLGYVRNDGTPDVPAWIDSVTSDGSTTKEVYIRDAVWPSVALSKLVESSVVVTDDDLREGYEASFGPRVEVLAIVLSDQRTAQKVWDMARNNPTDEFFGELAEQYSVEPVSSSNRGKVPPIRKHSGQVAIEREAFQMKPGELSGVIATGDSYLILRCQGYTDPIVKDPSAVREELTRDLREKKMRLAMAKRFDELKEQAEIDNYFSAAKQETKVATGPKATSTR